MAAKKQVGKYDPVLASRIDGVGRLNLISTQVRDRPHARRGHFWKSETCRPRELEGRSRHQGPRQGTHPEAVHGFPNKKGD